MAHGHPQGDRHGDHDGHVQVDERAKQGIQGQDGRGGGDPGAGSRDESAGQDPERTQPIGQRRAADPGTPIRVSDVLRFRDDRTGSLAELAVRPSTPLRVCVHGRSASAKSRLGDLRALLVADVLRRVAELGGQQVMAVLVTADLPPEALDRDASALGIYPPTACTGREEADALLRGSAHVHVAANTDTLGDRADGVLIDVGPVEDLTHPKPDGSGGIGGDGHDPLALRLVLLSRSHGQPVQLTDAVLADAETSLGRWRNQVAEWAHEPSRPIPAEIAQRIGMAFNDDLDTAAALVVLHRVESDDGVSAGAKFETFAFADRVLALELVREIGR